MIIDYLQNVLKTDRRADTINQVIRSLQGVTFGTIAVRGVSGLVIGSVVAHQMDKALCVIRKPGEGTHSWHAVEGDPVGDYVILDDLICTGKTVLTIIDSMKETHPQHACAGIYCYCISPGAPEIALRESAIKVRVLNPPPVDALAA